MPEAASRWLQAHDGRWRMRELAQRDSCVAQALALILANVDSMMKRQESRALGVAMNGDSIAYVVMASAGLWGPSSGIYESPPPIVHLRRSAGGVWKILPREHLLQSHGYFLPGGNLSCER